MTVPDVEPSAMRAPGEVVFTRVDIARATMRVAADLNERLGDGEWLLVTVLNGGVPFACDLMRLLRVPLRFETLRVARYRNESGGTLEWLARPREPVEGRNVLLVDDIFDAGETLVAIDAWLRDEGAADVVSCVLLEKEIARASAVRPDFVGLTCTDRYVFGYGMDLRGLWRNLDHIRALDPA